MFELFITISFSTENATDSKQYSIQDEWIKTEWWKKGLQKKWQIRLV